MLLYFIIACIFTHEYTGIYNRVHIVCIVMHVNGGGGEKGLRNVIYLFLKFLMLKIDPLNVVSYNVAVYKNITTLNEDLL
jgi:hypothetical protein